MLFSEIQWNNAKEIRAYVQTSAALSFEKCESAFADAEELYLRKVFGNTLMERIISIYNSLETSSPAEYDLLKYAQRAEANLAFYVQFDEMQLRLTDAGLQRQDSDTYKQAYRYQEIQIKQNYRNKGLNALDSAIALLEANLAIFPEWEQSEYRKSLKRSIVRTPSEVNDICFIDNSPIILLRLMPELHNAELLDLTKVLGQELYRAFTTSMDRGLIYIDNNTDGVRTEDFRISCGRYIICKAIASLCRKTGDITDRGLYFESAIASSADPKTSVPADHARSYQMADLYENMSQRYKVSIESTIELLLPNYFGGHSSDVMKRDNTDKKTYWA